MQNEKIHITRIKRLLERQNLLLYKDKTVLEALYSPDGKDFQPIQIGNIWGKPWQTGHFQVKGAVPESFAGKHYGLFFDCDGEACVMDNGTPRQGLTPKVDWYHKAAKHFVPLDGSCSPGERFSLDIEASANDLFGAGKEEYRLRECSLAVFDEELFQTLMSVGVLLNLAESLQEGTVRRQRILYSLNKICDLWNSDTDQVQELIHELLSHPAHSSALTAFSVGHAHLDLAWLWPIRETRRKGGRTFANALRLLDQYPSYIFGASQAQLYQWIKDDYPALYSQVKERIKEGRWEVQGASWVEFDTNLISSESIIRQFLYGKRFFEREFGLSPNILWLPDCFGFSGNLPQFLQGCEVDYFVTQKLSWNESNVFPHHLFNWEGIDGTRILAHQLPTNDYNFSNDPSAFLDTEKRYAQSEVCDSFLNLYGIGDGGGGPTRNHIEYGLRQQNLEGVSKFRFAPSTEFFEHLKPLDRSQLPTVYGELYLEYHRGTYTTQARMKQDNRSSEKLLSAAEFLAALLQDPSYPIILRKVWEDTLLLQFHDIIPGSSITMVYEDAHAISAKNQSILQNFLADAAEILTGSKIEITAPIYLVFNTCSQEKDDWHTFNSNLHGFIPYDHQGNELPSLETDTGLLVRINAPAWGCSSLTFKPRTSPVQTKLFPASLTLENQYLKVTLSDTGSIISILDKEQNRELLAKESNELLLWEDDPNNWGAWDINHFYRTTTPLKAYSVTLNKKLSFTLPRQLSRVVQDILIGSSTLRQTIELRHNERLLRISHEIDWREHHKMLRAHFHPDIHSGTATYGIQDGVLKRSSKPRNAWEAAQFEVPAQRFADLSQPDRGCALLCDVKFGYRIVDNEMDLNLLRSPADVDPTADIHTHSYSYTLYPHAGDYEHSDVFAVADILSSDLIAEKVPALPALLPQAPFRLHSDHITLDTVKPAESDNGIVLRLHECKGQNGSAELIATKDYPLVYECNMLEKPLRQLEAGNKLTLTFKPFEIKTILFREEQ